MGSRPSRLATHQLAPLLHPRRGDAPADQVLQRQTCVFVAHACLDDVRSKPGQLGDPACLSSVDALSGGDLGDRPVFAFIKEPLPVMRQPQRPDQGRVPRGVPLSTLCPRLDLKLLWGVPVA